MVSEPNTVIIVGLQTACGAAYMVMLNDCISVGCTKMNILFAEWCDSWMGRVRSDYAANSIETGLGYGRCKSL